MSFASYDIQGHGLNKTEENQLNLTINSLTSEAREVLHNLVQKF